MKLLYSASSSAYDLIFEVPSAADALGVTTALKHENEPNAITMARNILKARLNFDICSFPPLNLYAVLSGTF